MKSVAAAQAPVPIKRGHYGFQRIHHQGGLVAASGLLFPPPQAQMLAQAQAAGHQVQVRRRHQMRTRASQLPFLPVREGVRQHHADNKREHRVTQKFHLLVVAWMLGRLLRKGGMRESFQEERKVSEGVTDNVLKSFGVGVRHAQGAPIPLVNVHCRGTLLPVSLGPDRA